jgi:GNAT superfamily N-acetyltransferase
MNSDLRSISILDAPSNLGLKPPAEGKEPGVKWMAQAIRSRGLVQRLGAIAGRSTTTREFLLSGLSDQLQRNLAFVAYGDHNPIGFGRVSASPQSCFAGLWGGSVLSDFRGRGVYRALLAARIQHAKKFNSVRFLRVDALPASRPILGTIRIQAIRNNLAG